MFTYDCLLAAVLLTGSSEPAPNRPLSPMLLKLAIELEILDPREDQYLEGMSQDPRGDLIALRKRHVTLQAAPKIAESKRFPSRKLAEEYLDANRIYRRELIARLELDTVHAEALRSAINELDQLHHVWGTVRDMQCRFYYVAVRRQSLQHLRELIGDEAFYSGQLPPHVPYWVFPRLK